MRSCATRSVMPRRGAGLKNARAAPRAARASEALRRGCAQHAITLEYRPPGRPHYGGIVERIIGTAMTAVHELPPWDALGRFYWTR